MVLNGTAQAETLTGGADADTLYGYGGNDKLIGNAGDDVLAGMAGNDTLQGGEGDDYLMGGAGSDTLEGGNGVDWAAYEDATAGVTVSLAITTAQNTGGGGSDKLVSIENLYGSAFNDVLTGDANINNLAGDAGNDTLSGAAGDDNLFGGAGADSLLGGQGDDYIQAGAGNDTIDGGNGADWAAYDDATSGVTVNLTLTTAQDTGGGGVDKLVGVENVYGSQFNDVLTGDANNNTLVGDWGNDTLVGGAGDDVLVDRIGNNVIDGGDGFDTVSYEGLSFGDPRYGVQVDLQGVGGAAAFGYSPTIGAHLGVNDVLYSIEGVIGSIAGDTISGNAAENYLAGGAGDDDLTAVGGGDVLDGGDGDDQLRASQVGSGDYLSGGAGEDVFFTQFGATTLDGGAGDDSFYVLRSPGMVGVTLVQGGEGSDTLELGNSYGISDAVANLSVSGAQDIGGGQQLILTGVENLAGGMGNDVLTGDSGANKLWGGFGNDTLNGGVGADSLGGGFGADVLTGGAGKDVFAFIVGDSKPFDATGVGVDVITDFTAEDNLQFPDVPLGSYFETSAFSFASALANVNALLLYPSTFHEFMAYQVGADVYVFSGHADPNGAGLENVIKLANTNLDAISYDSFI